MIKSLPQHQPLCGSDKLTIYGIVPAGPDYRFSIYGVLFSSNLGLELLTPLPVPKSSRLDSIVIVTLPIYIHHGSRSRTSKMHRSRVSERRRQSAMPDMSEDGNG